MDGPPGPIGPKFIKGRSDFLLLEFIFVKKLSPSTSHFRVRDPELELGGPIEMEVFLVGSMGFIGLS